jgi:hypothetical protein
MKLTNVWVWTAVAVVSAACHGAYRDHDHHGPDAGISDSGSLTCGAVTCDQVPPPMCDGDVLRTYTASCEAGACSYPATDVACGSAGCCGDRCCEIVPSNDDAFGGLEPTGLAISASGTFNTTSDCTAVSALGRCEVVPRADLGEACVCRLDELSIGNLRVTGSRALVILAHHTVAIQTLLDVSGRPGISGPGASYAYGSATSSQSGGAGGSYATKGGRSSSAEVYGDPALVPLLGGMRGRSGGVSNGGGGGGGAVQITAGARIEVAGVINAGGGGGAGGASSWSSSGGSGGGSGGAVLLEAPVVVVTGAVVAAGGGGGGGGGTSGYGGDGNNGGTSRAWGGAGRDGAGCPLYGYVSGGSGGAGAFGAEPASWGGSSDYDSRCIGNVSFVGEGGGGGGLGRIRINTRTGCQCSGVTMPSASFGALVVE